MDPNDNSVKSEPGEGMGVLQLIDQLEELAQQTAIRSLNYFKYQITVEQHRKKATI
jgi:hypothetical protein